MAEGFSVSERLASTYKRLATTSDSLNQASDEYTKPFSDIDEALQKLNIGLVAWQSVVGGQDEGDGYWSRDIGYAKVDGKWGLAIRTVNGHHSWESDETEMWLFRDAPRPYRIEALEKLPDLLEEIIKNAEKTTKKLQEKTVDAREVANAVKQAAEEVRQEKQAARSSKKERK